MKSSELRELDAKTLSEKLHAEVDNLKQLRLSHAVSSLENTSQLKLKRRDVARIKTEIRSRQLNNK